MEAARQGWAILCGITILLTWSRAGAVEALGCDEFPSPPRALLEKKVELSAGDRASLVISIPSVLDGLVLASEQGADVTVSVNEGPREIGRAGSPISRTGTSRLTFRARSDSSITLRLEASESGARRRIAVSVFDLGASLPNRCVAVQRELAAGDSAYARGKAITEGAGDGSSGDAAELYRAAAEHYLAAIRQQPDAVTQLLAQSQLELAALFYDSLQDWASSRRWAGAAAATYARMNDPYGKARADAIDAAALMEVSLSYRSPTKGRRMTRQALRQARTTLASLVSFHAARGERLEQALAQNNIGLAFYYEGANDRAIEAYQLALALFERLGERRWVQIGLQNIALAQWELGRVSAAIEQYERVLEMMGPAADPAVRASVLNNSAAAQWVSGRFDWALKQFVEALELERKTQDAREQARSLHGIGRVYEALGEPSLALDFYRQALALLTVELDARGRAAALRTTANLLREQGHADEALDLHRQALAIASTDQARAQIQIQLARDLEALGKPSEALAALDVVIRAGASAGGMARALAQVERGSELIKSAKPRAAEADVREALRTLHSSEAPVEEFSAWITLAQAQAGNGRSSQALRSLDQALRLAEEVRLQSTNPELRAALLQPLRPAFDLKIGLLDQLRAAQARLGDTVSSQQYARLALQTSERARDRALEDFQRLDTNVAGLGPLLERRMALYKELASRHFLLEARRASVEDTDPRVQAIRADIVTLRAQIDSIETQIAAVGGSPGVVVAGQGRARVDLNRIPTDTAIIEYWLGKSDAFAWVLTRSTLDMVPLGSSAAITAAALALHESLAGFGTVTPDERRTRTEQLSALVLRPLEASLAGRRTLIFAPDQALHYVPFAALLTAEKAKSRFLIEDHDVALAPSIRTLLGPHPESTPPARNKMLLVADPVYARDDERLVTAAAKSAGTAGTGNSWSLFRGSSGDVPLGRLPGSKREASLIKGLLPPDRLDELNGFQATRERFLNSPLQQYRYIHVASHATTNAEVPGLSALILTQFDSQGRELEGRVLAADLSTVRLNAELVVLSACDTALGRAVAGEGLMGLGYIVRSRGARSVVSSLWEVPDEAATQLMTGFYDAYLARGATVGAALSEVMRVMLTGKLDDPAEWAAFTATVSDFEVRGAQQR